MQNNFGRTCRELKEIMKDEWIDMSWLRDIKGNISRKIKMKVVFVWNAKSDYSIRTE